SGDLGGAVFRSAYWGLISSVGKQTITWEKTTFDSNRSTTGGGGAAYVNNSFFTLNDVTFHANDAGSSDGGGLKGNGLTLSANNVTFSNNKAAYGGGVADWSAAGPGGVGTASNIHFSGNMPNDSIGIWPL
ncbi:MAG: hypothetical protein JWN04_4843, partial [Myxococcaceae bacterium]|nr:hypothetical protein [Myxococcaceae bacterium]